jgi:hypothetical protein
MRSSPEYLRWVEENSTPDRAASIGMTRFREGKCKCIVEEKQRDCADVIDVQMKNYLSALARYRMHVASIIKTSKYLSSIIKTSHERHYRGGTSINDQ